MLRLPIDAQKAMEVQTGSVIQNSRLKEIFGGVGVTHNFNDENSSISENFIISSRDKVSCTYEVFIDNVSTVSSYGIFKDNCTYDIDVNGEPVSSVSYINNTFIDNTTEFTYADHEIKIVFENTNSTSIKQFLREEQNIFMNIKI